MAAVLAAPMSRLRSRGWGGRIGYLVLVSALFGAGIKALDRKEI